jgi:hypothetical protein
MDEKARFLRRAVDEHFVLVYEHDPIHECSTLIDTEKGVRVGEMFNLEA